MRKANWLIFFPMESNTSKKINILHLIDTTGHGGAETVLKNIVCGLEPTYFRSFVILPDEGWLFNQLSGQPNVIVFVLKGKGRFNFRLLYQIRKIIRKNKINIVHTHLFGSSLYGNLAALFLDCRIICTFHGVPDWRPNDVLNKIKLTIIYAKAEMIVFVSKYLQKYFKNLAYIQPRKSKCIYNGIPLPRNQNIDAYKAKSILGFSVNDRLVTAIGNLRPVKGYDILLKAAKIVVSKHPDVKFVVAGRATDDFYLSFLLRICQNLKLEKSFFFIGYQENTDIIYKASDLFVLPSLSEGFSLSTIEAMAHKLPIIATKSGGPEEILKNKINGNLIAFGSHLELAESIIQMLGQKFYTKYLSLNAYNEYLKNFSDFKMIASYQNLYKNIIFKSKER